MSADELIRKMQAEIIPTPKSLHDISQNTRIYMDIAIVREHFAPEMRRRACRKAFWTGFFDFWSLGPVVRWFGGRT